MPLRFALTIPEMAVVNDIVKGGLTRQKYAQIANMLVPEGFGWATASGALKTFIPDFQSKLFADVWYRPYQSYKQRISVARNAGDIPIYKKDMIETYLKQDTNYLYSVDFDNFADDGSVLNTHTVSYYSNDRLTPDEVADRAKEVFADHEGSEIVNAGDWRFSGVKHNDAHPYE